MQIIVTILHDWLSLRSSLKTIKSLHFKAVVAKCDADEVIATQRRCYKKPLLVSKK
jgi:hypothetical protein